MMILIVAGLSLSNLKPRVWDPESKYYLPKLQAVMVSYADFHKMPWRRAAAMKSGIHKSLGISEAIKVYLDNGAFWFFNGGDTSGKDGKALRKDYREFVKKTRPDWYPVPQDFIPTPQMEHEAQRDCFRRTMKVNQWYHRDGYVPVVHIGQFLGCYLKAVQGHDRLSAKQSYALGGIVPNLLRAPKAVPYTDILDQLRQVRQALRGKQLHVFGVGGTATLHLAALLGFDSVDSSGWRNRAARGLVQLLGSGDRLVANLGKWRGREPSDEEWERLRKCKCPSCLEYGISGLKACGIEGFCNRATHNLWTLLEEAQLIEEHIAADTYAQWYREHLVNSTYRPLIDQLLEMMAQQHNPENTRPDTISSEKANLISQPNNAIY